MKKFINVCTNSCLALLMVTLPAGCADLSARQKLGTVLLTAGVAGPFLGGSDKTKAATAVAATASAAVAGAGATILILERRKATAQQAAEAEANARRALAEMSDERREALRRDEVRYLAVDTVPSKDTRGQGDIMVWDTEQDRLQSSTAYDVRIAPETGSRLELDTVITEYVGDGSSYAE